MYERAGYRQLSSALAAAGPEYADVVEGLDYQLAPRAKIFRRDAGGVEDLHDLKHLLRSNAWRDEPLSGGSPWGVICARGDLDPDSPVGDGCNDAKVTSYRLATQMAAEAVVGPTRDGRLPAFSWASSPYDRWQHRGMPDGPYDFEFELQEP